MLSLGLSITAPALAPSLGIVGPMTFILAQTVIHQQSLIACG